MAGPTGPTHRLNDLTFLVPYARDCEQQELNARAVVSWIGRLSESRLIFGGHDLEWLESTVGSVTQVVHVDRPRDGLWHAGRVRNALLAAANSFCPWAVSGSARWWPSELHADGQWFCPVGQLASGLTPLPLVAWVRRFESPVVSTGSDSCRLKSTTNARLSNR
jgi:hypothetical protein